MRWKVLPQESDDLFEQLLINRGIKSEEEREEFFNPKIENFENSLNIKGINGAKKRIEKAIKEGELIIAFGDYDVDGICGAAILYLGLTAIGAKVLPYIPHREKEGYGLSKVGLEFARDSGATLVITVDCGIVNFEQALFAKEIGLDLIITDHHQTLGDKRPDCLEIVHSTEMCGTAVAWSLVKNLISKEKSEGLLDLVAIATVSDMMPLVGVNRALVKVGLEKLNQTKRVGLLALFNEAGITAGNLGSYEIGHIIAPRLNAMGRLEHAIDSLRLICTKDSTKARKLADLIADANNQRKTLTLKAVDEAKLLIRQPADGSVKKIHILSSESWVPGIIGLVAGRVCEETRLPSIAISLGPTHSKGSARSIKGVNIVETIRKCSDILVAVGGHPGAAGFTIETTKIDLFKQRLEQIMDGYQIMAESELEIEAEVPSSKLNINLAKELNKFEPFGIDNPRPVLAAKNMRLSDMRTVGEGKHLKGKADNIDFIGFGMGDLIKVLQNGQFINLAFIPEIDSYNGYEKLQLKVKDLQIN
jgi:single-stranded-DNA-specific exonuclease